MKPLLSARRRTNTTKRLSVLNIVRTTALLTMGAFGMNALGQAATTCGFGNVDTTDANWQVVDDVNQIIFYEGSGETATIPAFSDTNCTGSGDVSFRLYKGDSTTHVEDDDDGTEDNTLRLLRRVTGVTVHDSGVTTDHSDSWGDQEVITYAQTSNGPGAAWGRAAVKYRVEARKAFSDVLDTFTFTVTVLPAQLTAPVVIGARAESTETVVVKWTGDGSADGSATHYQVAWRENDTPSYQMSGLIPENTVADSTHVFSIHGLESGTGYDIAVRGVVPGSPTDLYDDAYSPLAPVTFDSAVHTTKSPKESTAADAPAIEEDNPIRIATGASKSVSADQWLYPTLTETAFYDTPHPDGATTFTYRARSSNSSALRVEFIDDFDNDDTDHIIRLTALAEADLVYARVEATGSNGEVIKTEIPVKIGTNAERLFTVTSATVRWDLESATAADFEVEASEFLVEADTSIQYSMTGGTYKGVTYLEIDEEGTNAGKISVPDDTDLRPLESGVEFELSITATNDEQGTDTMVLYVDVVEGDDAPVLKAGTGDVWLRPLSEAAGGGSRSVNLARYFVDIDGGRLCYEIDEDDLTTDIAPTGEDAMVVADARLSGASTCKNAHLTIEMNMPSTDPNSDNFSLLNLLGVVEVLVPVRAYQEGDSTNKSAPVKVKVKLAFGANSSPSIRSVAMVGETTYANNSYTVNENEAISIKFTADDPLPNPRRSNSNDRLSHDDLCWSDRNKCTPCLGPEDRMSDDVVNNGVSHEFTLNIPAKDTDFEKNRNGYVIDLCATDLSGATHTYQYTVKLKDVDEPPSFKDIDDMYFVVGDFAQSIDLADFVEDGDGARDIVSYDANIVGTSTAVEVEESDGVVTVTPTDETLSRKAEVEIEVSATDTSGFRAYQYFDAHVKNTNRSPSFRGGLGSVTYTIPENAKAKTNVGSAITAEDPDAGDTITYELSGSDMFSLTTTSRSAQIVLARAGLDYERGTRSYTLALTASDGYGGAATLEVIVRVTDVNEPPVATADVIPDQRILLGMTECVILASDHFSDPDESDKSAGLLIEATSTRPGDVAVTVRNNDDVCVEGKNVGTGPSRITVTAEDREGNSVYKRFKVSVEQNNPPKTAAAGALQDVEVQLDGRSEDFDLYDYFDDGDDTYDETMTFTVTANDNDIATGAIVRTHYLRIYGNRAGTVTVKVTATDQNDQSHSQTFDVTVIRNDPPVANNNAIDDVNTRVGLQPDQIDAGGAFTDEGDSFTLSIGTDDPDVATLSIDYDDDNNPWITVHVHAEGTTEATLTAIDSDENTATVSFTITVGARNDPPKLIADIEDVTLAMDERRDIDLDEIFEDEGRLDIEIEVEDDNVADVIYRRSANLLRVYAYIAGDTGVTITATDDIGQSVDADFIVTVVKGSAPEVNAIPVDQMARVDDTTSVSMTGVFTDADGHALTYSAESSDEGVATVSVDGNMVEITGVTEGTATITVTATDPENLTAEVSFSVTVGPANMAPVLAIPLSDLTLEKDQEADISMDGVFEDDGELNYTISFTDDDVAHGVYRSSTNTIRVYGDEIGETEATVTATDEVGQSASDSFMVTVLIPNNPPVVVKSIDDQTIEVGEHVEISLDGVFKDEGDLTYEAESADDSIADVVYRSGTNEIRVFGLDVGTTTITVTATDDVGQTARTSFEMVVEPANDAPVVATTIPDQTLTVVNTVNVSIAAVFTDPDGDTLVYEVMSADTAVVTATLSGTDITLTGISVGTSKISITATDPEGLSAMTAFQAEVENAAPMVANEIDDQTLTVVEPLMISITDTFEDPDGDTLVYDVMSATTAVATATLSGTDVTLKGISVGTSRISITATDPRGLTATTTFQAEVENAAPMVANEIEDQTLTVVEPLMISIADTFEDPDGDTLEYTVKSSNTATATVSINGTDLTITGVKVGTTMITLMAADPDGLSVTTTFEAEVENAAPMVANEIEDQTLTVVEPLMISIADTFMDPDGDELKYSVESSNTAAAMASLDGMDLTITGVKVGTTMITVTATDPSGLSAMTTFEAEVENAAPMVANEIEDQTLTVVEPLMISIADTFMDPDGDELKYTVESSNTAAATASLDGTDLTITGVKVGMTKIAVTATDPGGLSVTTTFEAEVENAAPMVANEIEDQTLTVVDPAMVSIADTFMDPDGDEMKYSVESSNTAAATVDLDNTDLTVTGVKVGMTMITVTATDPDGLSAMTTFEAEVENAAPMLMGTLEDREVTRGEPMTFSIEGVFVDPDGDALTNEVSSDAVTIATASVSGDDVTINGLAPGTATITVTASDPDGLNAKGSFMVTVETVPDAVGTIADITLQVGGEAHNMDIAPYFKDDDGDTLSYAIATEGSAAMAVLTNTDLTLTPTTKGSTKVTLTATDPKGRNAMQSFMANVSDSEIKAVGGDAFAGIARSVISSTTTAIGSRIEGNRGNTSGISFLPMIGGSSEAERVAAYNSGEVSAQNGVKPRANRNGSAVQSSFASGGAAKAASGVSWGTIASNSNARSTEVSLQSLVGNGFSQYLNGNGGLGSISAWGAVDYQIFEGSGYEGNATAFFLGADAMITPHVLFGAAIAHNRAESDYSWGTATQTLETTTTSVMPYGAYKPNPKAVIWGVVGRGSGEATTTVVNAQSESSDLTMNLGMFGASARFASQGRMEFGVRGDVAFVGMKTESGSGAADELEAAVNRARLGLDVAMHYSNHGGPTITPYGELNLRYDGGDGVTGSGLEVAGGLRINSSAFELDARGHTVAAHSGDDFTESGFSLMATFNPNRSLTGLSVSIAPSWGQTTSPQNVVWTNSGLDQLPIQTGGGLGLKNGLTLNANVGYGMFIHHDRFLLTPYFEYSEGSKDNTSMLLGAELKQLIMASSLVDMNFTLGTTDSGFGSEGNQLEINATIQF